MHNNKFTAHIFNELLNFFLLIFIESTQMFILGIEKYNQNVHKSMNEPAQSIIIVRNHKAHSDGQYWH